MERIEVKAGKMASNLESMLDRRALRRMAGARSFERGEEYFHGGQVGALVEHQGTIAAKVQGTRPYRVKLWVENGEMGFSCTCPMGADGAFCKHCVAVGLTWLADSAGASPKKNPKTDATPVITLDDARAWLNQQNKQELVEMLLD